MKLSVDPGVTGTGYAVWKHRKLHHCGTIYPAKTENWGLRAESIVDKFEDQLMMDCCFDKMTIECPTFMRGYGGYTTASTGDLVKLTLLTGMLVQSFSHWQGGVVALVEPSKWKGQLPKEVCRNRVLQTLPGLTNETMSSHAFDAIGIGLWEQGRF